MPANNIPQSWLYNMGYGQMGNDYRDRSAEQQLGNNSQYPTQFPQFNYMYDPTQAQGLGRYQPPTLRNAMSGADTWNNQNGYSYNLPNNYGGGYGNTQNTNLLQMLQQLYAGGGFGQGGFGGGMGGGGFGNVAQMMGANQPQSNPLAIQNMQRAMMPQFNSAYGGFRGRPDQLSAIPNFNTNPGIGPRRATFG